MKYDPTKHHRRSIRLPGYDYSSPGQYFVTICSNNRIDIFGEILDDKMSLNDAGKIVKTYWHELPAHFHNIRLDSFVIMPNHIHGIIEIFHNAPVRRTLGDFIGFYKFETTRCINELHDTPMMRRWQRNYYEHIIADDGELDTIREYIINNPANWQSDKDNRRGRVSLP